MRRVKGRPTITCHIFQSMDGKISGDFFDMREIIEPLKAYNQMKLTYRPDTIIYGATTTQQLYARGPKPDLSRYHHIDIPEGDYIADVKAKMYLLAVDPDGTLFWNTNIVGGRIGIEDAHVVILLKEDVPYEYLAYLREQKISYLRGGRGKIDLKKVMESAYEKLGIRKCMLLGGGFTNGTFADADMIDAMSIVIAPVLDGSSDEPTLCESGDFIGGSMRPVDFVLKEVRQLPGSGVYLYYTR